MKSYEELKSEYKEKNYSKKQLSKNIILYTLLSFLLSELFIFLISTIPFILGVWFLGFTPVIGLIYLVIHFFFYKFYIKKDYEKDLSESYIECKMIIQALKELKKEISK